MTTSIRLNFQSVLLFTYIFIHSSSILLLRNELNTQTPFVVFVHIDTLLNLITCDTSGLRGLKKNLHIYWKQYEHKDFIFTFGFFASIIYKYTTHADTLQGLNKSKNQANLLLPNVRDQYFGNISYYITVIIC